MTGSTSGPLEGEAPIENQHWLIAHLKRNFILAWPLSLMWVSMTCFNLTNLAFLGRLGDDELAGASLAMVLFNATGMSIVFGFLTAFESLGGQAFGAKNYPRVLQLLQRSVALGCVLMIPVFILWIFTEPILVFLGQDERLAELAGIYIRYMIPGAFFFMIFEVEKRYLILQNIIMPCLVITVNAGILNIALQYLLVFQAGLGFIGSPLALSLAYFTLPIQFEIFRRVFVKDSLPWPDVWFSPATLRVISDRAELRSFLLLGVPGIFMVTMEWLNFEATTIIAGLLGKLALSAHAIVMNTDALFFMIPLGMSTAVGIRISHYIGANNAFEAKRVLYAGLLMALIVEAILVTLVLVLRHYYGRVYSEDQQVVDLVSVLLIYMALTLLLDATQGIMQGALRGCGKQKLAVFGNVMGYLVIGLPSGSLLAFYFEFGISGLWWGIVIALFVVCLCYAFSLWRQDWDKVAEEAHALATKEPETPADPSAPSDSTDLEKQTFTKQERLFEDPQPVVIIGEKK